MNCLHSYSRKQFFCRSCRPLPNRLPSRRRVLQIGSACYCDSSVSSLDRVLPPCSSVLVGDSKIYRLSDKSTSAVPVELRSLADRTKQARESAGPVISQTDSRARNAALIVIFPPVSHKADVHCRHPQLLPSVTPVIAPCDLNVRSFPCRTKS